jgi:hypothetical protein
MSVRFGRGKYSCPKCGNVVEVFVTMTAPPTCWSHLNKKPVLMELIKKTKTKKS